MLFLCQLLKYDIKTTSLMKVNLIWIWNYLLLFGFSIDFSHYPNKPCLNLYININEFQPWRSLISRPAREVSSWPHLGKKKFQCSRLKRLINTWKLSFLNLNSPKCQSQKTATFKWWVTDRWLRLLLLL